MLVAAGIVAGVLGVAAPALPPVAAPPVGASTLNFGPNVLIFDPGMPTSQIQATVDAIASQQVPNQFGTQRYALLFKPGTYGSLADPLTFQVGYYTEVAGLGASPTDVTINGHVDVYNQCDNSGSCVALTNFWRSLSNLTINVTGLSGCRASADFWAVSQAAPMRRVNITGGNLTLMDYCNGPSFASGGFIADSQTGKVINGSQQQFLVRNSNLGGWSNGVWNQVFSGDAGAPAQCFPAQASCGGPYTTLATSPVTEETPFLYTDSSGTFSVFVPAVQHNTKGTAWAGGTGIGMSLPIQSFFVANPSTPTIAINMALSLGENLILTPGVYNLAAPIVVRRADTVVIGLGFATLVPQRGNAAMIVIPGRGVKVSGLIVAAGSDNSAALMAVGDPWVNDGSANDPDVVQDVFFRIGGATPGQATNSLVVNSSNAILDDIWAWRADHGSGVGWTTNTADTGVIVNGNNVTAYGLFVEHYQENDVIWNGQRGTVVFFQNEMPYDPPSQAAWMAGPGVDGYAALLVSPNVTSFQGYGMGSYSFFNRGVDIFASNAFQVPATLPAGSLHDLLTIFLAPADGRGGILNVVNNAGGSSTIANPDVPASVASYP